jgi:hypothetical protein
MSEPEEGPNMIGDVEFEYTVLLVFPGYGTERENAEMIVEMALDWLNTHKETPGFRFAPPVGAHLELLNDAEDAQARIEEDDSVATVILHDIPDDERDALLRECHKREIGACYTVDAPRPGRTEGPMKLVIRKKVPGDIPAHRLCAETLTAPVEEDEDSSDRAGEVVAMLALGVMQHHWSKKHRGEL